jgi:hypothetical protein
MQLEAQAGASRWNEGYGEQGEARAVLPKLRTKKLARGKERKGEPVEAETA